MMQCSHSCYDDLPHIYDVMQLVSIVLVCTFKTLYFRIEYYDSLALLSFSFVFVDYYIA